MNIPRQASKSLPDPPNSRSDLPNRVGSSGAATLIGRRRLFIGAASTGLLIAVGACSAATSGPAPESPQPGSSPSERSFASIPASAPASGTGTTSAAHVVTQGDPHRYTVALTFDLVDDRALAAQLLDVLRTRAAVATVFAAGPWVTAHDAVARRIRADGHELGNLAVADRTVGNNDAATMVDVIVAGDRALQPLIGAPEGWLRIRGTSAPSTSWRLAAATAGHRIVVGSDVSMPDGAPSSTDEVVATVSAGAHPGAIIALDVAQAHVAALPAILDHLLASDLHPVAIGELLRFAAPAP